jgi:hypothetical protein
MVDGNDVNKNPISPSTDGWIQFQMRSREQTRGPCGNQIMRNNQIYVSAQSGGFQLAFQMSERWQNSGRNTTEEGTATMALPFRLLIRQSLSN